KSRGVSVPSAKCRRADRNGRRLGSASRVATGAAAPSRIVTALFLAFVVVVDLEQKAAGLRLERPVLHAGRPARIGRRRKALAALALRVVADEEVARQEIAPLPVVVDERRGRVGAGRKAQQARATAGAARLVDIACQDLLLNAGRIAGRRRPALVHVDFVKLEMRLVHRHGGLPPPFAWATAVSDSPTARFPPPPP